MEKFRRSCDYIPVQLPISAGKTAAPVGQNDARGACYGRLVVDKTLILPIFINLY